MPSLLRSFKRLYLMRLARLAMGVASLWPLAAQSQDAGTVKRIQSEGYDARSKGPLAGADFVPPSSWAPLIRRVRDGVVNIKTVTSRSAGAVGSGFLISQDGYVVTNHHVVENARAIRVTLVDGREFSAQVTGTDAATDLALLKLQGGPSDKLPTVAFGDSDALEVGDWVLVMGNPFGLDHSVAHGIISAKERVIGMGLFDDFIQTDALINPGHSGGPLFNMQGQVVGVTTATVKNGQGIGFALPINMVKELLPNLRQNGKVARGWLGALVFETRDAGAVVRQILPGSPAEKAGLLVGDRIVAVNGRAVEGYLPLLRKLAIVAPGAQVSLSVIRDGKPQTVSARLTEKPKGKPAKKG